LICARQRHPGRAPTFKKPGGRIFSGLGLFLAGGALLFCFFQAYRLLGRSAIFQVTATVIQGCRMTSKDEILKLSGIDIHTNLLAMDSARVKTALEAAAWIEAADVSRKWPNKVMIAVRERIPVALVNRREGLYYLDGKGNIFAPVKPNDDLDFPVISGATAGNPDLREALLFLRYAGKGNAILPLQNISEIRITPAGEQIVYLLDRPFPIYLGKGTVGTKYYRLVNILKDLYKNGEFANTAYIRMDYVENKALIGRTGPG